MHEHLLKDFDNDPGQQLLHSLSVRYEFPVYVKQAGVNQFSTRSAGATCAQLAPEPRLPCHTKAATWLSYAYFAQQKNTLPKFVAEKIAKAMDKQARYWDIGDDVAAIDATDQSLLKAANESSEAYPLRNNKEISAAAIWLSNELRSSDINSPIEDRIKLAQALVDTDLPMSSVIWKASCRRGCYDGRLVAEKIASNSTHPAAIKLAAMCRVLPPKEMQAKHAMAATICDRLGVFDKPAELSLAVNTAQPVVCLSNGAVVKTAALRDLQSDILDYSAEASLSLSRDHAKAAAMLPEEMADDLIAQLQSAGLPVETHTPGKHIESLSLDDLTI